MNEIEELMNLEVNSLPPLQPMLYDDLHQNVLKNLHLELGSGPVLYLISPSCSVLNTVPSNLVIDFLNKKENLLNYLKEYLIQNVAIYTVILEMSSYFIEQNNYLVLARFREKGNEGRKFEVKFYTHEPKELLSNYNDKIYIGRDFIDLYNFKRKYWGVKDFIISIKDQYDRLLDKAEARLKNPLEYGSFFQEIKESINETYNESLLIIQSLPPYPELEKMSGKELIEINSQYREITHFLVELRDEVDEFENLLRYKKETDFVRYVTKFKKDLTNLISYLNIKINGVLGYRITNFKFKHS
ncbi:MAG: hypothetical protein ACPLZD_01205 [Candidatus Saccharicenans sp.]|nr:MAG: hypothetical protein C0168_09830 [Candidatus Aminicenantes bacterium]HEK84902.1 hypothetical protein [Candidatus Aminicenantes bacterium]